jgi:HSP20 family protein
MAITDLSPWTRARQAMTRFSEGHPFIALQRDMNRLFDNLWSEMEFPVASESRSFLRPVVEMVDKDGKFILTAELPGLDEKDVEVKIDDGALLITGEKKCETEDKDRQFTERFYGRFERRIPLAQTVEPDKVTATFAKGVLKVTMPKAPAVSEKAKKIPVKAA